MSQPRVYCVLGGGGSFGLYTSRELLEHGDAERVIAVGRSVPKSRAFTLGVGEGDGRYEYHAIHIGYEFDRLMELLDSARPYVIVNYAAQGESAASWSESWRYFETNAVALVRLVEELQRVDWLERFIQISTSELYGSCDSAVSEDAPLRPTSPYAASKAAFDMYLMTVASRFPFNIIRPSNAYGPGQQLHRVIPKAILYGLTERKLALHGGGVARKSYIHSRDLARCVRMVAERASRDQATRVYNAGPHIPTPIRHVIKLIADALEMPFDELCDASSAPRFGEDACYWLNSGAIKRDVGWEPEIGWHEGLSETIKWVRANLDELRALPTDFALRP